ncbi:MULTISPECIES: hydroxyacylglutathione hydrolase [Candidatus Williamhamiltonella]|uniref:Hydroxyacylglutathione hydrolase n=1 Tax=Candidatus Williamhamiltonella defendens TaxID=138072 RepID=A0A2D3TF18_9ENTR|nr:hydroxyacylglutathione hydrolase [Candidatus Hamiltonella defensa]ATW34416.1 hydroxyacylglutathione hydrolase [Candidatus Hamiltonella defensa]AYB49686.1 hydroxyacylglutathione hydrolase [Candidatus Hamiltonella defensa]
MRLIHIPALESNYIWLLADSNQHCVIVDPGEASPVESVLTYKGLLPQAILLTHHHQDHLGGVPQLLRRFPDIPVYGPKETNKKGATILLKEGDQLFICSQTFSVIEVPGHTLGHIAYYAAPYLFCGDTLFSAGCGRLFEGTADQMYDSIQKLIQLPDETLICAGHEYTLSNLKFARSILPDDPQIALYQKQAEQLKAKNQPTLPALLKLERQVNLFLRCKESFLQKKMGTHKHDPLSVFSTLREMKDRF